MGQKPPKAEKERPQPPAEGGLPAKTPCQHPEEEAHPDVAEADGEAVQQPDRDHPRQKQRVRQGPVPGAQRPEKAVIQPQHRPQQQAANQAVGCQLRGHRNRLRQPLCRGSS